MKAEIKRRGVRWNAAVWGAVLGWAVSCRGPSEAPNERVNVPAPLMFQEGQSNILLTYRDPETGRFETVERVSEVPEAARGSVVITDLEKSPEARGSSRYVQVADVRSPDPSGRYPVAVASRHQFERLDGASGVPGAPAEAPGGVVVYSARWCGVCKKTKRLLSEWGVRFEDKDIEASRSALEELGRKAQQAGFRPGGVPVIDVRGRLLQGLDPERLEDALREAGLL